MQKLISKKVVGEIVEETPYTYLVKQIKPPYEILIRVKKRHLGAYLVKEQSKC